MVYNLVLVFAIGWLIYVAAMELDDHDFQQLICSMLPMPYKFKENLKIQPAVRKINQALENLEIKVDILKVVQRILHLQMYLIIQNERCQEISSDSFRQHMKMPTHYLENDLKGYGCPCNVIVKYHEYVPRTLIEAKRVIPISSLKLRYVCSRKFRQPTAPEKPMHFPVSGHVLPSNLNTSLSPGSRLKLYKIIHALKACSWAQETCKTMESKFSNIYQIPKWQKYPCNYYLVLLCLGRNKTDTCFNRENEISKLSLSCLNHLLTSCGTSGKKEEVDASLNTAFIPVNTLIVTESLLDIFGSRDACGYLVLEIENIKKLYIYALDYGVLISVKIFVAWLKRLTFRSLENQKIDISNTFIMLYLILHLSIQPSCQIYSYDCPDSSKKIKDNPSANGSGVYLSEPVKRNFSTQSREIIGTQHNSSSQELRECSNTYRLDRKISLNLQHICKPVYGTIDLKIQRSRQDDEKSGLLKSIVCDLTHANLNSHAVTAPVFNDKHENKKPIQRSQRSQCNNTASSAGEISGFEEENSDDCDNNVATSIANNVSMSYIHVSNTSNELSADGHTSTGASGYTNWEEGAEKRPRENNLQSRLNNDIHIDSAISPPIRTIGIGPIVPTAACGTDGNSSNSPCQTPVISIETGLHPSDLPNPEVEHADIQRFEPLMQIIDKIADGQRVPPQITMRYEMLRFCTLRSFPKENKPFITRFAQAGFYYANSGDEVVCYSCARRKSNWREDDNPMEIHRQLNPNCNFLLRNSEVNVPIRISENFLRNLQIASCSENTSTTDTTPQNTLQNSHQTNIPSMSSNTFQMAMHNNEGSVGSLSKDTIPPNRTQTRAHGNFVQDFAPSEVSTRQSHHATVSSSTADPSPNGYLRPASLAQSSSEEINRSATPKYPKYCSKTVRVTSFNDCGDIVIPPDTLADSGFFYAGFGDCVRCFQCGVGLRHWSEEDDPWIEHSRWSKDCAFVRQTKGQEFVNLVQMAVQYSQNQNENDQSPSENVRGTSEDAGGGGDIENLMHTDAAQSVLEMGYHPNIIRRAIRTIREINDGDLTAANLMEKIFELEEAESSASNRQSGESLEQSQRVSSQSAISELQAAGITTENNTTRSQTPAEVKSHVPSNACLTRSAVREGMPSVSMHSGRPETTRTQKKSQLLEQKKLKEENEKLKQQSICTICRQNDVCIVFLPCGHLVTCEACAPTVRYCTVQECGRYIKGTVRTYLA